MKNKIFMYFFVFFTLFVSCFDISLADNVKKSVEDNREDNGETGDDSKDGESMEIPTESEPLNVSCTRRQNSQMHEIRAARNKQFPFMVSIISDKNEHICSGSLISLGLILTTAECVHQPINSVIVNTTSDRNEGTVSLHVIKSEKFPSYTGSESSKDVAIIYTEKHNKSIASKLKLSNFTETKGDIDLEVLGFGLNADVGKTKELQYIGVEIRYTRDDIVEAYVDCIDTKVPTCFRDTGGPAIYDNKLYGIVIRGSTDCAKEMSSTYSLHKRVVDILPTYIFRAWLDEKIRKNEEKEPIVLETYPSVPVFRKTSHVMTSAGDHHWNHPLYAFMCVNIILIFV